MKKILGLDLGTNSVGWALVEQDFKIKQGRILGMGSRIIPMTQDIKDEFGKGNSISQTAERTGFRGVRRIRERHLLRRERLHKVLNTLGFLPEHYAAQIDFKNNSGKFLPETEPKLAYNENEFIFKSSFEEMVKDFKEHQPQLLEKGKLIPYDWTIYYLRKKALSHKLKKEELAWLILNFNQKRGYYQLRGEEEEINPNKLVEFHSLKIIDVIADEKPNNKGELWYSMHLENGWEYRRSSKTSLHDWKDKTRDFIVTTDLNDDGTVKTDKEGLEKRSFRAPKEDDWTLVKKKTEQEIENSNKFVGTFIYDTLLKKPQQKIRGRLIQTIERKHYKKELIAILQKQIELQPELFTTDLLTDCIRVLYKHNEAHRTTLSGQGFVHLFVNDIIFYQRPLRSQKSNIGRCSLEFRVYKTKDEAGIEKDKKEYLKAIPKSHPLYQEFRLWQWLYNLRILTKDDNKEVTQQFIQSSEDLENLFELLNTRKEIKQDGLIKSFFKKSNLKGKELAAEVEKYRWNYVEDKVYPCNETGTLISSRLAKVENLAADFLTKEIETHLWHIIYSVTDKVEYEKALKSFAIKNEIDVDSFVENFRKLPPFESEYGAYSFKALRKLLPLMRIGKYWSWETFDKKTKDRIDKLLTGEFDDEIKDRVREKSIHLSKEEHFQGLPLWLAQYVVYDRHSEAEIAGKWNTSEDIDWFLNPKNPDGFKQHSLRNPIVEQVVTETLRVVRDIWSKYGDGEKDFFDEIHIELGRDMKNSADQRKRATASITENENTNQRIKNLLAELMNDSSVENVRPYSPMQQEALKIYEDGVLSSTIDIPDDIQKISKTAQPSKSDLQRYKLWLEQKYKSPYTGQTIPLNKLFTNAYQIEHIIPQARYFDDSFSNKVICESAVNLLKDKQLGFEFIKNKQGAKVDTGFGKEVEILDEVAYQKFVKNHYSKNRAKLNKLLMDEIPEKMIERQLNDTRFISKYVSNLLSNIVRKESDDEGLNSKNLLPGNGKITNRLKQDWGLNDVWNDLVLPRFNRMNEITNSTDFTSWNERHQKNLPTVPIELSKGFQKKRIDHRHHAMDALVVACATRSHINLLNNQSAKSEKTRYDLQHNLRIKESYFHQKENKTKEKFGDFIKPWETFTEDARHELEKIVASFKQNLRVINKATNKYESYKDENGNLRIGKDGKPLKKPTTQRKGDSWAIRKPLHKDTVSGAIKLRKIKEVSLSNALDNYNDIVDKRLRKHIRSLVKMNYDKKLLTKYFKDRKNKWNDKDVSRNQIYYWEDDLVASRVSLDSSFTEKRIVETVTDSGIQKILLAHLEKYQNKVDEQGKPVTPETLAFSSEGIDEMNKNIMHLNDGTPHHPIYKLRTYETKGNKFQVGYTGNKKTKFVEAAKGTNLFFAIYQDQNGKRNYETIPLNIVIERQKQGLSSVPEVDEKGNHLLFHLSPNELVYVPTEEEMENVNAIDFSKSITKHLNGLYKVVSFTGKRLYVIPSNVATTIVDKIEYSQLNKIELTKEKEICIKLKSDRLGNVFKA